MFNVYLQLATAAALGGKQSLKTVEEDLMAALQHYMHVHALAQDGSPNLPQQGDGLTLDDKSDGRVEGTYITNGGKGVYFLSESDDTGKSRLLITTTDGANLIYVLQLREEMVFISVGNDTLLYYHDEDGGEIYKVTASRLFIVLNAVQESTDFEVDLLRTHLPKVSDDEGVTSLNHLLDLPEEIQMIIDAAKEMEAEGLSGEHSPALRVLFAHILNLEYALWEKRMKSSVQMYENEVFVSQIADHYFPSVSPIIPTLPPNTPPLPSIGEQVCSSYPAATCPVGRCPYKRSKNNCFGMCGPGCTCWKALCGDCCTHRGCIDHDACCAKRGFFAKLRCYAPLGFTCSGRFSC